MTTPYVVSLTRKFISEVNFGFPDFSWAMLITKILSVILYKDDCLAYLMDYGKTVKVEIENIC